MQDGRPRTSSPTQNFPLMVYLSEAWFILLETDKTLFGTTFSPRPKYRHPIIWAVMNSFRLCVRTTDSTNARLGDGVAIGGQISKKYALGNTFFGS